MKFKTGTPLSRSLKEISELDLNWLKEDLYLQALQRTSYSLFGVKDITESHYVDPWEVVKVKRIPDRIKQGKMSRNNFSIHLPLKLPRIPRSHLFGLRLVIIVDGYSGYVDNRTLEFQFIENGPWEKLQGNYTLSQLMAIIATHSTEMLQ